MKTQWIALLRGINMSGNEDVSMDQLTTALSDAGLEQPASCLLNGNIVFSSESDNEQIQDLIKDTIRKKFQLRPRVAVVPSSTFREVVADNPFEKESQNSPSNVHVLFLRKCPVRPNFQQMERFKTSDEMWSLTDFALYLFTPTEFKKSKLAVRLERLLGVSTIARSWSEISEILSLLD